MKKFVTFEGIDGSGKSTVSKRVYEELKRRGYSAIYTFEPTDGEIGKCAKKCIDKGADPLVIALLFVADRIEHVRKIKEWLEEEFMGDRVHIYLLELIRAALFLLYLHSPLYSFRQQLPDLFLIGRYKVLQVRL